LYTFSFFGGYKSTNHFVEQLYICIISEFNLCSISFILEDEYDRDVL